MNNSSKEIPIYIRVVNISVPLKLDYLPIITN